MTTLRADCINLTGRRFGDLLVLGPGELRYFGKIGQRYWRVECACGKRYEASGVALRHGATKRCTECRNARGAVIGRTQRSIRCSNGWTIGQIALAYGIDLYTVYRRWARGWPEDRLSEPVRGGKRRPSCTPRRPCGVVPAKSEARP